MKKKGGQQMGVRMERREKEERGGEARGGEEGLGNI